MVTFITFYLWLTMLVFHLRHWFNNSFWKLNLILSHLFSVQFSHSVMSDSPSIFPSIRVFPNELVICIRSPKYWSFSFSISPSDEHSGLISFRMDWLDLLAVQGTHKSLLQHHSSKASILRRSAFFMVQLLHSYMTTGKAIALTRLAFVGKVMPLLFNKNNAFLLFKKKKT